MAASPVAATRSDQVLVPSVETSTLYPEMASPPFSAGAVQDRSTWVSPFALAVRSVGGSGAVLGGAWACSGRATSAAKAARSTPAV